MVLYGRPVAEKIYDTLKKDLEVLKRQKISPKLAVVLVGEDPASLTYVKVKEKRAALLGVEFTLFHFPASSTPQNVEHLMTDLNLNPGVSGIVLQLPLPAEFETDQILKLIDPRKDVDGFSGMFPAPTAAAILAMFEFYNIDLQGKKILIIGRGRLVGEPLEALLKKEGCEVGVADSGTKDLERLTREADLIITATGAPALIKPEMVKSQTIIIDAGTAEAQGKMVGDVAPETYKQVRDYSPVPGGVGPVTVACLFHNVVQAVKK